MKPNIKDIEDNLDNFRAVQYRMGNEGMAYCFEQYSSFVESVKKIRSYVENKIETLSEEIDDTTWGDY